MNRSRLQLLRYLTDAGGWHYGLELVEAGFGGRSFIYIMLAELLDLDFIEQREEAETPSGLIPRKLYRSIVVKRAAETQEAGQK